jgi:hypothetical protein
MNDAVNGGNPASARSRFDGPERLRLFDSFASPVLGPDSLRPPPPLSPTVGSDRHSRVRAMMREEGVVGLIAVSNTDDTQAGDYLTGVPGGWMTTIAYLPLDGEPFAFAPPECTPLFPATILNAMESGGTALWGGVSARSSLWVKDWVFGYNGIPAFTAKLRDRVRAGAVVGAVNLVGTQLGDYLQSELPQLKLKDLRDPYSEVRAVKRGEEVASVRSACAATEAAAEMLTKAIAEGATEGEIAGTIRCNIGRRGFAIGDVSLASHDGFGAPIWLASFRTVRNVGNAFDSTWRSRGMPPRVLKRGQLISSTVRCWSAVTEAHLHLSVSMGKLTGTSERLANQLGDALQRGCDRVKPGIGLADLNGRISEWLGLAPDPTARPHCYVLNPTREPLASQRPGVDDIVLQEGMHVHLNPHVVGPETALGVGCGLLVGARGAEMLNHISCKVQTV